MSRYDVLRSELDGIRRLQIATVALPSLILAALIAIACLQCSTVGLVVFWFVTAAFVLPFVFHSVWFATSPPYARWTAEAQRITNEIRSLKQAVDRLYDRCAPREKGQQFKKAYHLVNRTVPEFEKALAIGMYFERREVIVTAIVAKGIVWRVTDSIGSDFKCSPADDPRRWKEYVAQLACDEVRQYHNHPDYNNKTQPSDQDYRMHRTLKDLLEKHADKLRSFIVYWNQIREWRIIEYGESQACRLSVVFDMSLESPPATAGSQQQQTCRDTPSPARQSPASLATSGTVPQGGKSARGVPHLAKDLSEPRLARIPISPSSTSSVQVDSSCISAVSYDQTVCRLYVTFSNGSRYFYDGVPSAVYVELVNAKSKGQYLNSRIVGRYPSGLMSRGQSR